MIRASLGTHMAGSHRPANALSRRNQNFCDRIAAFSFPPSPSPNRITAIMKYVLVSGGVISGVGKVRSVLLPF
jgi:hypothetical protein